LKVISKYTPWTEKKWHR